jgi:hypothetical protein
MNYEILKTEIMRDVYAAMREAQDYQGIATALNRAEVVSNPEPQGNAPKRLTLAGIFAVIATTTPADVAKLSAIPGWVVERAEAAIGANDRASMANYLAIAGSQLSAASKTALTALLAETEPDPNWQEYTSGATVADTLGLGVVRASDVQRVLA